LAPAVAAVSGNCASDVAVRESMLDTLAAIPSLISCALPLMLSMLATAPLTSAINFFTACTTM
jgi:hypothetical protein